MDAREWIAELAGDAQAAAVEADIRDELEAHLELAEEALRGQGLSHAEARTEARARFGDLERTLRACRRVRTGGQLAMQRLQWILILVLGASTVGLLFYGRQRAALALEERQLAMADAMQARALLQVLQQRRRPEPVDPIVVGVGDHLDVQGSGNAGPNDVTEVQRDGHALFRDIGWLSVAGKSRPEVEELLTARYASLFENIGPVYVIVKSPD